MELKDKEIGKIYETKEYDKFKVYEWNRIINQNTINKIAKSVLENGWRIEPIIVNEEYGIIDGQHRYTYAKNNNLSIYYMIIPGLTKEDCQIMNSVRSGWLTTDYIRFYAIQGNASYARLMALNETYKQISLTSIVYALVSSHSEGGFSKTIANGKFECTTEEYELAVDILDYINSLMPSIRKVKGKKISLVNAIIWCYKSNLVDLNRLANQVETFANEMIGVTDLESALTNLEKYYNYNLKKKENIVYLVTEWKKNKLNIKEEN